MSCSLFIIVTTDCGSTINTITNGSASVDASTYGSNAEVNCSEGYENPSSEAVTCQANGTWSQAFCLIKGK